MTTCEASEAVGRRIDCATIVEAVAEREGVSATDLLPALYDVIETDALESLLTNAEPGGPPVEVEFEYAGHTVLARSDGALDIE